MLGYDAARWHALLNDFPAALLTIAVLFDLGAAATKRESLMWAAIWTLWAGVIGGWAAVIAGELASDTIEHGEAIHEIMEKHETMALLTMGDRKSTRLNSSHVEISYAVFCLKKK